MKNNLGPQIYQRVYRFDFFNKIIKNFKNFMAPFYGSGSTTSRLEPLWGGSLLFTNKFPEIKFEKLKLRIILL